MHLYYQGATQTPQDWTRIDLLATPNAWRQLPKKTNPGYEVVTLDNNPGWIYAVNCQGIVFSWCEQIAVEVVSNALVITNQYTNPNWYPSGWRYAQVWQLNGVRSDARFGGRLNTDQYVTYYAEADMLAYLQSLGPLQNTTLKTYAEFKRPNENVIRYGPNLTLEQASALDSAQTFHGWEEWVH